MKNSNVKNSKHRKDRIYKELVKIYSSAIKKASSILKDNGDIKFFECKDGWDDTPEPFTGNQKEPMTVDEIFVWMYENSVSPRSIQSPYIYTDEEIKSFKKNRALANVEEWMRSIDFYKKKIEKYESKIRDVLSSENEHENS